MIQKPEDIKDLLRKQAEGRLSAEESLQLKLAKLTHDNDEWLDLVTEVLWELEQELPDDSLKGWRPDFAAIIKKGDPEWRRKKMLRYRKESLAACLVLALIITGYWHFTHSASQGNLVGDCVGLSSSAEIPLDGFFCTLQLGDSIKTRIDSNRHGLIVRIRNLEIRQDKPGMLRLVTTDNPKNTVTSEVSFISITTSARQQYVVLLPNGTSIRLNAKSSFTYPLDVAPPSDNHSSLNGVAYVKVLDNAGPEPFILETPNSQFQMNEGSFVLSAWEGNAQATLLEGNLTAVTRKGTQLELLKTPGDMAIVSSYSEAYGGQRDSLWVAPMGQPQEAILWMKATRNYKNVPLRTFINDMSHWYGFKVETLHCIPISKRISVAVCYQAPMNDVFAEIRNAGITLYEKGGVVSFCDPHKVKSNKPLAFFKNFQTAFTRIGWLLN